jgi:hypothetical protein
MRSYIVKLAAGDAAKSISPKNSTPPTPGRILTQKEIDDLFEEMRALRAREDAEYLKNVKPADAGKEVIREATKEAPAPNPPTPPNLNQSPLHNPPSGGGGGHVPSSGGSTHTPIIASGGGGGGGSYHAPNIKAKPTGYNKYLIGGGIAAGLGGAAYLYNKHRNQDKRR